MALWGAGRRAFGAGFVGVALTSCSSEPARVTQVVQRDGGSRGGSPVVLIASSPGSPGHCDGGASTLVRVGVDANGDGTLGDGEAMSEAVLCAEGAGGTPQADVLLRTEPEPPGPNCPEGGLRLDAGFDQNGSGSLDAPEVSSVTYVCVPGATAGHAEGGVPDAGSSSAIPAGDFSSTAPWTISGQARIEGGHAVLSPDTSCLGGKISQPVTLPDGGGALALEIRARSTSGSSSSALAVSLDGDVYSLGAVAQGSYETKLLCLDRALQGRTVQLGILPASRSCSLTAAVQVDRIDVRSASGTECPVSSFVPNGNFELGNVSWTPSGAPGTEIGASGINGGLGARVVAQSSGPNSVTGTVYVPTHDVIQNPALRFMHTAPLGASWNVLVGEDVLSAFTGTGSAETAVICLPPWLRGQRYTLEFRGMFFNATGELDDIEVVDDGACAWQDLAPASDFEVLTSTGGKLITPWLMEVYVAAPAEPLVDAAQAHQGQGVIVLSASPSCTPEMTLRAGARVPASVPAAGPALRFWYRTTAFPQKGVRASVLDTSPAALFATMRLDPTTTWQEKVLCLRSEDAGRPFSPGFAISACGVTDRLWIDDIQAGTDPSCPP